MTGRCAFITYGCRLNQYDTQAIREEVLSLGYEECGRDHDLDVVVVNSCTITARAGEKVEGRVRSLAKKNPAATIIVTGCLTEEDRARIGTIPGVEHIIGNEEKDRIPELIEGTARAGERRSRRADRHIFDLGISRFAGHTRAFLKIQDGCDSFCTYCVIPYLRGASRSRSPEDVVEEAERLAEAGHRELVLTGIHLREYGCDLGLESGFLELLPRLREIPGVERVRLSSIGERTFTDRFLALFRDDDGLCPAFHIPLQSGCDAVLERMRRDYTTTVYLETLDRIRETLPNATITTDLMVGFPGETEGEFQDSLETCRRARFLHVHLFPYSPRPRTRAARSRDHVPEGTKLARMAQARAVAARLSAAERQSRIGTLVRVLIEKREEQGISGLSREGLRVRIPTLRGGSAVRGDEIEATITALLPNGLEGCASGRP